MLMFSTLRLGPTPVLNALACVMLALTVVGAWVAWRLRLVAGGRPGH